MGQESRRKSFVFYTEWKEVLVDYPPEVRLEVYDAVIEYAESGTLSELKPLAKMAFSFIKKQIDSNKDKYDDIIAKRSEAGKRGMDSRYNKDVTKDSKSNKCYHKVTNLTSDNKSNKSYQSVTNLTINDYENDNDDVLFQKEEEKVFGSSPLKPLQELFDEMKRNDSWAEGLIMNKHHEGYKAFNQETLSDFLEEFFRKLQNENCTMVNPGDEYRHFSNWLNKKLECKSDERTKTDKRTNARTGGQDYNYGHEIEPPHIIKLGGQGKV